MLYHVNPNTGNVGLCKARKNCPFGGANEHFTSTEAARSAYEAKRTKDEALVASKTSIAYTDFVYIEDFSESSVVKSPLTDTPNGGHRGARVFVGGRAHENLSGSDVAKAIRSAIQSAVRARELPKDLIYSARMVGSSTFRITVTVKGKAGWPRKLSDPAEIEDYESYKKVESYLKVLGNQWKTDETNAKYGFFNSRNSCRVDPKDERE